MKSIIFIFLLGCYGLQASAQLKQEKKPSTFLFHAFYNDFESAQLMRTSSLKNMLNNGQWYKIDDMQMGFGVNYLKGISRTIDIVTTLDASSTDYLYKNGSNNGSNKFLLDLNAGLNIKLFNDSHKLVPYFSGGAGLSAYKGKTGFYIPAGAGIQFNLFDEAFVLTSIQYRRALNLTVNDHFYYSLGIGTSISKKKKKKAPAEDVQQTEPLIARTEITIPLKNLHVTVSDEQTGLPLSSVEVTIIGPSGKIIGVTDVNGQLIFNSIQAADYTVSGVLHGINTTNQTIAKNSFDTPDQEITISISHHDPRFTVAGKVNNKSTRNPEGGVLISAVNTTLKSTVSTLSEPNNGTFTIPIEPASDFTVSGKKAGFISNIEKLSTKGLNRSKTLYVQLELEIEEAIPGKTIALENIYYDLGSSRIRGDASSDLEKLVKFLQDNPALKIEIASHSDSRGSDASNLILSQSRAQEVINFLQKQGVNRSRLIAMGYGETRLVNGCVNNVKCTEAEHEQNRRTEFKVIDD
ncbi:MAG: OmpA family protein [Daejeonella sp.]